MTASARQSARGGSDDNPHRRLGNLLREARRSAATTGARLAELIGTSQATISKIENGTQPATLDFLVRFVGALRLPPEQAELLLREYNGLPRTKPGEVLVPFSAFDVLRTDNAERHQTEAEADEIAASTIRVFQPHLVPGILQTDDYALSVFRTAGVVSEEGVERAVAARRQRRKTLKSNKPFTFLITEGALRNRVCPSSSMVDQLEHIRRIGRQRNVTIGLLPWAARVSGLQLSSYYIFDMSVVSIELSHGQLRITAAETVEAYSQMFDLSLRTASFGSDADRLLDRLIADYERLQSAEQALQP